MIIRFTTGPNKDLVFEAHTYIVEQRHIDDIGYLPHLPRVGEKIMRMGVGKYTVLDIIYHMDIDYPKIDFIEVALSLEAE